MADDAGALDLGTLLIHLKADSADFAKGFTDAESISETVWKLIESNAELTSVAVASAFVAMGAAAVKAWADIEDATTKGALRMGTTSTQLRDSMMDTARQIAASSSTNVNELVEGYKTLADAGYGAAQSVSALSTIDKTATATGTTLTETIKTLTSAQTSFGLVSQNTSINTKNLVDISNTLIKASQLGTATFQQLGAAMDGKAGVSMKQMGVDFKEGVAIVEALNDQGIKGDGVLTNLALTLDSLRNAASANSKEFQAWGVQVFDTSGKLLSVQQLASNLRDAMSGLDDQQKTTMLSSLGMSERTATMAQALAAAAPAIGAYRDAIQDVGDTMENSAKIGDETLTAQFTQMLNQAKELTLELGSALAPVVKAVIQTFKDATADSHLLSDAWNFIVTNVGPALITIIGLIGDAINGWRMILDLEDAAWALFWEGAINVLKGAIDIIAKGMDDMVNNIVTSVNFAISAIDKILPNKAQIPTITFKLNIDTSIADGVLDSFSDDQKARYAKDMADLNKLANTAPFSASLLKNYDKTTNGIVADNKKISDSISNTVKGAIAEAAKIVPVDPQKQLLSSVTGAFADVGKNGYGGNQRQLTPLQQIQNQNIGSVGGTNMNQLTQLTNQLDQEQKAYAKAQKAIDDARVKGTATTNKQIEDLMKSHADTISAIQLELTDVLTQEAGSVFTNLADIAKNTAGAQSGVYKTMFAASKAFAIADATIKMSQAIAGAIASFSQGGWAGIIAGAAQIGTITSEMSSIISSIQSVQLAFGGGKATGGPVMAGMAYTVGEKGQERFVPNSNGTIIPNDQIGGGRGNNTTVNVNNYSDSSATVSKSKDNNGDDVYDVIIKKVKDSIATDIQNGTGKVNRSMQGAYGLSRGKTG